jgi:hypothetical protein
MVIVISRAAACGVRELTISELDPCVGRHRGNELDDER